jgi:hypothetical protein
MNQKRKTGPMKLKNSYLWLRSVIAAFVYSSFFRRRRRYGSKIQPLALATEGLRVRDASGLFPYRDVAPSSLFFFRF